MEFEIRFIEFLQSLSNPFLTFLMQALTYLGDELFFIVAAVIIYWCINKRYAYKFVNIYLVSAVCTEGLKSIFKRARPYDAFAGRTPSIGEKTGGHSFPSGHSNSIANMSAQIYIAARKSKYKRAALITGILLTLTVMLTRMFLAQHYLTDVLAGAALGIGLAVLFNFLFELLKDKEDKIFIVAAPLCIIVFIILLACGVSNSMPQVLKVLGAYTAFTTGYYLEKSFVRLEVKSGKWWKYVLKVVIGLGITLGIKEGLKLVLPEDIAALHSFLRYFLIAIWAALGAPAVFKLLKL